MTSSKNYKLALTGLFGALSILLAITPLGYIKLGFINITVMHIPVILATLLGGLVPGVITGLIFGLTSCVRANLLGSPFFGNPLCSVLPRMMFPVVVWGLRVLFSKIISDKKNFTGAVCAAVGTFFHTFFVMTCVYILFAHDLLGGMKIDATGLKGYFLMLGVIYSTNGIWEILGATIIVFAVLSAIFVTAKGKSKLSEEADGEE